MNLTNLQKEVVQAEGNLIIEGGPGSGKTTVSIIKAEKIISEKIENGQKILFLSFSNAAVSRVIEAIDEASIMSKEKRKSIEIDTYHSFFWKIIKTHAYLLGYPRKLNILLPSAVAVALSEIRSNYDKKLSDSEIERKEAREHEELKRIAKEDGLISFDLFSEIVLELLVRSKSIVNLLSNAYPFILLDEFQDTNSRQWEIIKLLGLRSILIALADPEQRIFDFIGANPERLNQFKNIFSPTEFNFGSENHRSNGTDISLFGNDILTGKFRNSSYKGVNIIRYPPNTNQAYLLLKIQTIQARKRMLVAKKKEWSVAVLVPTKKLVRVVSDIFRNPNSPAEIRHVAAIDMEGTILSAEIIAFLLQPLHSINNRNEFINLICNFFLGKGGSTPTKTDLSESAMLKRGMEQIIAAESKDGKMPKTVLSETLKTFHEIISHKYSSDPDQDWLFVRHQLEKSKCKRLQKISEAARNIRILDRGTQLRDLLSENWRVNGNYTRAFEIVRQAFTQEHFSTSSKPEKGVIIMNMHKAKGKQFDEVIIFESWKIRIKGKDISNSDRIVRMNSYSQDLTHAKQNLRVSVTRSKSMTTIMTSTFDSCILLPAN